ncbi:HXXEE domain-containing protein [uncultured Psychroserpens sp.]|uniref:HXXEE domain-containing protein n=1 Tax=uncultured Psychroserpens sp. TaxID=255436 RepID=UPI00260515B5|nr:HXXEE domain-containing protein [uncultured Psychroserpens sp.]
MPENIADSRISKVFLLLVCFQALHSIEEYIGKLWENFPPATWLTGVVSDDHHLGFLIINIGLFVVGLISWYVLVKPNHKLAKFPIIVWILIELMNGVGHPLWSIMQGSYTPGVLTAPFLLITALYLIKLIYDDRVRFSK